MGPIEAKRVILDGLTIPDISSVAYDNPLTIDLLRCTETVDEEVESNGTNIADCPLYSKFVGMKLNLMIRGTTDDELTLRWMLYKCPDGESLISSLQDSNFHSSNDIQNNRELRKMTLAKGMFLTNTSSGVNRMNVFVRRATLKRLGSLRENDIIRLQIAANSAATVQALVYGFGTLYVRMN